MTAKTSDVETVSISEGVAVVTLNRPQVMNALNLQLCEEIMQLAPALDADPNVDVIIFTGAGEKAFCVGADLKERGKRTTEEMYNERRFSAAGGSMPLPAWPNPPSQPSMVIVSVAGWRLRCNVTSGLPRKMQNSACLK